MPRVTATTPRSLKWTFPRRLQLVFIRLTCTRMRTQVIMDRTPTHRPLDNPVAHISLRIITIPVTTTIITMRNMAWWICNDHPQHTRIRPATSILRRLDSKLQIRIKWRTIKVCLCVTLFYLTHYNFILLLLWWVCGNRYRHQCIKLFGHELINTFIQHRHKYLNIVHE